MTRGTMTAKQRRRFRTAELSQTGAHRRQGLTVLELLIILLLIGIVGALLLMGVQHAREAARGNQCQSNLARLGAAFIDYEQIHQSLPAGVLNDEGPIRSEPVGYHFNWIVPLLPALNRETLLEEFDRDVSLYADVNASPRARLLPFLLCPSDPLPATLRTGAGGVIALSNYAGCHHPSESPIDSDNRGVLFLNSDIRSTDIPDGAANTIFVGEKFRTSDDLGWASGTRATLRNTSTINADRPALPENDQVTQPRNPLFVGGFGSHHRGGAYFLFGDGSVRMLSEEIEQRVFSRLGSRGGEPESDHIEN